MQASDVNKVTTDTVLDMDQGIHIVEQFEAAHGLQAMQHPDKALLPAMVEALKPLGCPNLSPLLAAELWGDINHQRQLDELRREQAQRGMEWSN